MKILLFRLLTIINLFVMVFVQQAAAFTQDDFNCAKQGDFGGTCFYDPNHCPASSGSSSSGAGVTIDNLGAQKVAQQASAGSPNVGYALYDSSGKLLASYNDNFQNFGASITKSMLLVAYLKQIGSNTLSSEAKSELTNMIENSDNDSANWVYNHLSNGATEVNNVASSASMTGFQLNDTNDSVYLLGQSKITANDFAKFFSKIDSLIPFGQKDFALGLLANLSPADQNGLLQANLPGNVYSKEGWKPESSGLSGAPYIVNQAAQFSAGGTKYGVAVTVGGTATQSSGETIVKDVVTALVKQGGASTTGSSSDCSCSTASVSAGPTVLNGSGNEEKIFNYFVSKGLTSIQSAGIDGNFGQESGWDPTDGNGYLAQWGGTRVTALSSFANSEGKPVTDLGVQLDFVWKELNSDYSAVLKALKAATTVDDAVNIFMGPNDLSGHPVSVNDPAQRSGGYENPGTPQGSNRVNFARDALKKFGNGAGGGGGGGCASSGSADCATATGSAKILCEAKKYTGIYYEYGGGHLGDYHAFKQKCPDLSNPPNNQPFGGPSIAGGRSGNPSPCAVDCSALVSFSVDAAFNLNYVWIVAGSLQGAGANNWKSIPWSKAQPGDVATSTEHTEVIDHVSGNTLYTIGAHDTGSKDGPETYSTSYFNGGAWHWTGPGSVN